MLLNNPVIKSKIALLWHNFWSGGIANPMTAIEQISYLLFMKQLDELDFRQKGRAEFLGLPYNSKFAGEFTLPGTEDVKVDKEDLRWRKFKDKQPEDMLLHVQTKVFPFLQSLNGGSSNFARHMKNAVFIIPKANLLSEAIAIIDEIYKELEIDAAKKGHAFQDIQGDVYEMLLNELSSSGKNGQFRTPRHIIKLIVELVGPQFGQIIGDPACGTGGFLLGAYQYIVTQMDKDKDNIEPDEDGFVRSSVSSVLKPEHMERLEQNLWGYDFDVTMVRLGLMNLMMHGIDSPQVDYMDTLSKRYTEENKYHIVMTNPPFTGSIDKGDLSQAFSLSTSKTELLFIERTYNMLKMGGTAGIIVPQGVLFGSSKAHVKARQILIDQCELKAVITMPSGVFKPYAGVSTAILVFTKGGETRQVWFYEMQSDGRSLDDRRQKEEGYGDLQDIVARYKTRDPRQESDRKAKCFFVTKEEIVEQNYDLSLSRYKEDVLEEMESESPEVIFHKLLKLEEEIDRDLKKLMEISK